jgi:regulator of sigma E protease
VLRAGDLDIVDGQQLREWIRSQVQGGKRVTATWKVERAGRTLDLQVTPDVATDAGNAPSAASAPSSARRRTW